MSSAHICDECGFNSDSKHGLSIHEGHKHPNTLPYNNPDELERLYCEESLTQREIAEEMDCNQDTVIDKMEEFGIEKRASNWLENHISSTPAYFRVHEKGYEDWIIYEGDDQPQKTVMVHQLLACLNNDPHEVFAEDTNVHHGNNNHPYLPKAEHPRANWEGNLEVMSRSEHVTYHNQQYWERQNKLKQDSAMDW